MDNCPCGSKASFQSCCEPYLTQKSFAPTAEALMRSRYTAYTRADIDYISKTHDPEQMKDFDYNLAKQWAETSQWQGLEVLSTEAGLEGDEEGVVEFIAKYEINGDKKIHHEKSLFRKINGKWYFSDSKTVQTPIVNSTPKVGRNDPCGCGSGKKYKKCCG